MPGAGHVVTELLTRQGKALPHSETCPTCRERPAYTPGEMAHRHEAAMSRQTAPSESSSSAARPGKRKMPGSDEPRVWFEEAASGE